MGEAQDMESAGYRPPKWDGELGLDVKAMQEKGEKALGGRKVCNGDGYVVTRWYKGGVRAAQVKRGSGNTKESRP